MIFEITYGDSKRKRYHIQIDDYVLCEKSESGFFEKDSIKNVYQLNKLRKEKYMIYQEKEISRLPNGKYKGLFESIFKDLK